MLENHGAEVYVDKKDEDLPSRVSLETATKLRSRFAGSKRFILFATDASKDSRWMPWGLGLADDLKRQRHVAILPGVDNSSTTWPEQEYLGIYDRVVWGRFKGDAKDQWLILNRHANEALRLGEWINN